MEISINNIYQFTCKRNKLFYPMNFKSINLCVLDDFANVSVLDCIATATSM